MVVEVRLGATATKIRRLFGLQPEEGKGVDVRAADRSQSRYWGVAPRGLGLAVMDGLRKPSCFNTAEAERLNQLSLVFFGVFYAFV